MRRPLWAAFAAYFLTIAFFILYSGTRLDHAVQALCMAAMVIWYDQVEYSVRHLREVKGS